jgi:cysteine-rich repeat protein
MARVAIAIAMAAGASLMCACTFDWDALDPGLAVSQTGSGGTSDGGGGEAGMGGMGGMGGIGGMGGAPNPCGNGSIDTDEQCDDGNVSDGDGCGATCEVECAGLTDPSTFHCYVIVEDPLDWQSSRDACATLGADFDLTAISSQEEQTYLSTQTEIDDLLVPDTNSAVLWLGGTDVAEEGTWLWANGEPFFDNWVVGEPSNDGTNGEHCSVYLHRDAIIGYDDRPCDRAYGYLCERPPAGRN